MSQDEPVAKAMDAFITTFRTILDEAEETRALHGPRQAALDMLNWTEEVNYIFLDLQKALRS